jgi:MoaA/NifB/PqqE/SkfB family radical SAM enzyme
MAGPPAFVERCDDGRDFSDKGVRAACYAPFATFDLDPRGNVQPCCINTGYPLGNVGEQRLLDIWHGPRAQAMRDALGAYDLSYGCGSCRWQIDHGKDLPLARKYDQHPVAADRIEWPVEIGFALSNTCNLECVQCNGEYSSRIRSRREGRPPLPSPYGDEFFEDLREFLPHLRVARFLGGEPFITPETYRVWDLLIEMGLTPECDVTTNATRFNPRVERLLEALPTSISVSIDSPNKATFEAIRRNADFDEVMANVARFRDYCRSAGTSFAVSHCLMRNNWWEFGDMLRLAESWDALVCTSTVFNDPFTLYKAPLDELARVVETLEAQNDEVVADLELNRGIWEGELDQLRKTLRSRQEGVEETVFAAMDSWSDHRLLPEPAEARVVRTALPDRAEVPTRSRLRLGRRAEPRPDLLDEMIAELRVWAADRLAVLEVDPTGVVTSVHPVSDVFYGLDTDALVGGRLDDRLDVLKTRLGPTVVVLDRHATPGRLDTLMGYTTPPPYSKNGTWVRVVVVPSTVTDGHWTVILASDEFYPPVEMPDGRSSTPVRVELSSRPSPV